MASNESTLKLISEIEEQLDKIDPSRIIKRQQQHVKNYWDLKAELKVKCEQLKRLHFWQSKRKKEIKSCIKMHEFQLSHFYNDDEVDKVIQYTLEAKGW